MYQSPTVAYAHQTEALERIRNKPSHPSDKDVFALLCDMGTGKSKMLLDEFGQRVTAGEIDGLLIVAPAGSYRNWLTDRGDDQPSEVRKHLPEELFLRLWKQIWVSGAGKAAKAELNSFVRLPCNQAGEPFFVPDGTSSAPIQNSQPVAKILVVNIEALSGAEGAFDACSLFLKSGRMMMAVDESTTIKNPTAARTKSVILLGELAVAKRIMTGLPTPRSPMDLFSQFNFLDWRIIGQKSIYSYKYRYAVTKKMLVNGRSIDIIVGFRNTDELQTKIAPYIYRVRKEDCLDLPPKIYERRDVEMTKEQRRLYTEIKDNATVELSSGDHVTATQVITQILRLHQVLCGFVGDEEGGVHEVPTNRLSALLDILDEHDGKAIIWAPYDHSIRAIASAIEQHFKEEEPFVAKFWGGNSDTRAKDESRFLSDPKCRWIVSTPAAGGRGNTWVAADLVIYYANNYDLEQRSQSEDRAHRVGQKKSVTYIDLICPRTVDEIIIKALRGKINLAATITGDSWKEWLI